MFKLILAVSFISVLVGIIYCKESSGNDEFPCLSGGAKWLTINGGCRELCVDSQRHYREINEAKPCTTPGDFMRCSSGRCMSVRGANRESNYENRKRRNRPKRDIMDDEAFKEVLDEEAKAIFKVRVNSAVVRDEDMSSPSDPKVQVKVYQTNGVYSEGQMIGETTVVEDSNRPVWQNEPEIVSLPVPLSAQLRLEVVDYDRGKWNDFLGYVQLSVSDLRKNSGKSLHLKNAFGDTLNSCFINADYELRRIRPSFLTNKYLP